MLNLLISVAGAYSTWNMMRIIHNTRLESILPNVIVVILQFSAAIHCALILSVMGNNDPDMEIPKIRMRWVNVLAVIQIITGCCDGLGFLVALWEYGQFNHLNRSLGIRMVFTIVLLSLLSVGNFWVAIAGRRLCRRINRNFRNQLLDSFEPTP